jgi:hypothetical protein
MPEHQRLTLWKDGSTSRHKRNITTAKEIVLKDYGTEGRHDEGRRNDVVKEDGCTIF